MSTINVLRVNETLNRMFSSIEFEEKLKALSDKIRNGDLTPEELELFIITEYKQYCQDDETFEKDVENVTWLSSMLFGLFNGSFTYAGILIFGKALLALMAAKGMSVFLTSFVTMLIVGLAITVPVYVGFKSGKKFSKWLKPIVENRLIHEKFKLHMKEIELLKQQQFQY